MDQIAASPVNRDGPASRPGPEPCPDACPEPCAARVAGHFGELVQGRLGRGGPVALVTLPCPALVTEVRFSPAPGRVETTAPQSAKLLAAAELALRAVAAPGWGGRLDVRRASRSGGGAGQSTADVLGAVRAVAGAFRRRLAPEEEARLCLLAEGAVDPLMHEGTMLFASREARVVRRLRPLPRLSVVGGFAGPGTPTNPADHEFPAMGAGFSKLEAAIAAGDARGMAEAARASAEANQARNPNPAWEDVLRAGRQAEALGPVVAHTGSAIGLLLAPETPVAPVQGALRALGLTGVIAFET
jgi:uncharacterized protein involved in propanediol utilization